MASKVPDVWLPRNDYVLVRIVYTGQTPDGIAVPEVSVHGKDFIVVGIGPKVENLKVGDVVLMIGQVGIDYYPLPNSRDLIVLKEQHIVLVKQPKVEIV